ncbi:MAG: T9SS type A sorting domain-containing protein [Saprospiraceae bacterium]|jgi:uncharacterized repeat protein (TIGR01451 family)|nr:T9SS type A sorting domain-containing protein [Saprospiraceae bacterium]
MKKAVFILFFGTFFYLCGHGQSCFPDGIVLTTQAEIDNFSVNYPGCTVIEGSLQIDGDITNLSGLSGLTAIGKDLFVRGGPALTNLNGLGNITSVGGNLAIAGNVGLTTLSDLGNITSVGLEIYGNTVLPSLNGIQNITAFTRLTISENAALTNLNGLENLTTLETLIIGFNPALTSLAGIQNITSLSTLEIASNASLTSLNGLENITSLNYLNIQNNAALSSLSGIQNITSLTEIFITGNGALTSLNGLENITSLDHLYIQANATLTTLSGIQNITSLIDLQISGNVALTNLSDLENLSSLEHLYIDGNTALTSLNGIHNIPSLSGLTIAGNLGLTTLSALENLNSLESFKIENNDALTNLGGIQNITDLIDLFIWGNDALTNLSGLENLTSLENLNISDNAALTSLTGIQNIPSLTSLGIYNNDALTSLSGLESITSVQFITIGQNTALTNLSGMQNITAVQEITIDDNAALTNLSGLENITSLGALRIFKNGALTNLSGIPTVNALNEINLQGTSLTNLDGLENLSSLGHLLIYGNAALSNLNGLQNIHSLYSFTISQNAALTSLNGLGNITSVGVSFEITDNPALSDCAIFLVCDRLLNEPNSFSISNNAPGCNTPEEIAVLCNSKAVTAIVLFDNNGTIVPLENIIVSLTGDVQMNLRATDANGFARFGFLENGDFTISLPHILNDDWQHSESREYLVSTMGNDSIVVTLVLSPLTQCPVLTVDLGMPSNFRGCLATSQLEISIQNTGTVNAQGVKTALVLPSVLELLSSAPPLDAQSGDTLYFDLGELPPFREATITLTVKTKCDTFLMGQTLCIETFAKMDNACPKTIAEASEIKLSAICVGDTLVRLGLKNIGNTATQGWHEYKIIRNELVEYTNAFNLDVQQSLSFDFPADGATWRMEATKYDDGTQTAVALENCGGLTPSLITAFWQDQGPLEYDFECRQVIGSYDPNLKSAVPTGVNGVITANQPLQYTIDFQNTGTDTAFRVLLRDVLPTVLDLNTFRPIFSSHPNTWKIRENTLEVLFSPIALPDSNVNEPASHGYFSFEIDQKPNLQNGTYFENTASIFFDFNPPIITNTVGHSIGQLTVSVDEAQTHANLWQVLGNPTRDAAIFRSESFVDGEKRFELFDAAGRVLRSAAFSGQEFEFQRETLPSGMYFFQISDAQHRVFTGKIVVAE